MNCYKCGAVVADGTKFCTNCGADLIIDTTGKTYASFGGGGQKLFEEEQKAEEANSQNASQEADQNTNQGANQNYYQDNYGYQQPFTYDWYGETYQLNTPETYSSRHTA